LSKIQTLPVFKDCATAFYFLLLADMAYYTRRKSSVVTFYDKTTGIKIQLKYNNYINLVVFEP